MGSASKNKRHYLNLTRSISEPYEKFSIAHKVTRISHTLLYIWRLQKEPGFFLLQCWVFVLFWIFWGCFSCFLYDYYRSLALLFGTNERPESPRTQPGPLNEMHFTNGVQMNCQVTPLVPIVPLVLMDDRNPTLLNLIRSENILSPLNEMHFTNGVQMNCQVTPLVPIVPLVLMDDRNPPILNLIRGENILSPLNEMHFTNGVPMVFQVTPLVPIVPLVLMDDRNPTLLNLIRGENILSPLNEMHFTNGVQMVCQVTALVPIVPLVLSIYFGGFSSGRKLHRTGEQLTDA